MTATDDEIVNLKSIDDLFDLEKKYRIGASGAYDFQAIISLSQLFFQNEDYVPKEVFFELYWEFESKPCLIKFYKLEQEFIEKVATVVEDEKLYLLGRNWGNSEYWQNRNYSGGMGLYNCLFGLNNLCKFAVRDNKNVYLMEEINESNLEK